jgi:hypothetical protein
MAVATPWWERRRTMVLLALAMAIPLIWPATPPLTDLPGHMGRYAVQIGLKGDPVLGQYYDFKWALIGNLGMDLLVQALAPIFGLETTVKALVMAVPVLQAAGLLLVAREVHGRVPPTALFALPLTYAYPFQFGFVNFSLSVGLALLLFALWLRVTRNGQWRLRAAIFVPASFLLWLTHTYGWGLFGLMVGGSELMRHRQAGTGWLQSIIRAAQSGAMLAGPIIPILMAGSSTEGQNTGNWFQWQIKIAYFASVFRDRWRWFDLGSLVVVGIVLIHAWQRPDYRWNGRLGLVALLFATAFILMPRVLLYSAYADMRLVPMVLAMAIIAISPVANAPLGRRIAVTGLAFFVIRLVALTASTTLYDQSWRRATAALDHVPRHARVLALVGRACAEPWNPHKLEHVAGLAVVRRHAFVNDQWAFSTAQLLRVTKADAPDFAEDPSQMVMGKSCGKGNWGQIDSALGRFPRAAFDYVWMIAPPEFDKTKLTGLEREWTNGRDSLYRVVRVQPTGQKP